MDDSNGANLLERSNVLPKEFFTGRSPRSPLNTHSLPLGTLSPGSESLELAINRNVDNSIEQLYHYICEMQSSDHSPSIRSFLSYGEESRIDSELRFLAGGDYWVVDVRKDVVTEQNEGDSNQLANEGPKDCSLEEKNDIHPANIKEKGLCDSPMDYESSPKIKPRRKSFHGTPSNRKGKDLKRLGSVSSMSNHRSPPFVGTTEVHSDARFLGPYLLKQARDMIASGEKSQKALELALRAMKSFEVAGGVKPSLDFIMCLHVVAALYCKIGRCKEAISILEKSIDIPVIDLGHNHALAKFAGCMQLGDTYAMLGQIENSILFYTAGLEIQRQVLGEKDSRFGETCRYLAEAHVQALQFDEAEKFCLTAIDIHKENGSSASLEEAADRRLMGFICDSKGDYQSALEHYVLASSAMAANGQYTDVAAMECNIGDAYLSLARCDDAIIAYEKALSMFKSNKGKNYSSVASVLVRLSDLHNRIGKISEAKSSAEKALQIYAKPMPGSLPEEVASGLVDISAIYESLNEPDRALQLLQKALKVNGNAPGQQSTIAGIEAQIGVLYYILGSYSESYNSLKKAILKFRATGETKPALFGATLNQMGLACVQLCLINEAAGLFEEARHILEVECGSYHADTLGVYSNLAGTYDAMGRTADAIDILEYIIEIREEKLGTENSEVEDEKHRLAVLVKEAGTVRNRKSRSLERLLADNSHTIRTQDIEVS